MLKLLSMIKALFYLPIKFDAFSVSINKKIDRLEKGHQEIREALIAEG